MRGGVKGARTRHFRKCLADGRAGVFGWLVSKIASDRQLMAIWRVVKTDCW
jgi:hypothetical protein